MLKTILVSLATALVSGCHDYCYSFLMGIAKTQTTNVSKFSGKSHNKIPKYKKYYNNIALTTLAAHRADFN